MNRRLLVAAVAAPVAAVSLLAGAVLAQGDATLSPERVSVLADTCASCHGPSGVSPGAIPSIAGRPADALTAMLLAFKTDQLPSTIMGRIARGYSDAELAAIAQYYSAIQPQELRP